MGWAKRTMNTEQNPSAIQIPSGASVIKPRRRWLRALLMVSVLLVIGILIGRKLTIQRWHTLYSHPLAEDKLMLVVECPDGWEEDTDRLHRGRKINEIAVHPKPTVGFLHWWQEHILHQPTNDHSIYLSLTESDRPASKEMNDVVTSIMKEVDPSPTTTLTRHRLGPEIDMRDEIAPAHGSPADTTHRFVSTFIYLDETPTNEAASLLIMSNEYGHQDRNAERIRKEIIRRVRVVKK